MKKIINICLLTLFLFPLEGHVSMVDIENIPARSLKDYISSNVTETQMILLVEGPFEKNIYTEVIFPIETHYAKKEESKFVDYIEKYKIKKVLRSSGSHEKEGDLWIWGPKAHYGLNSIKRYHETGIRKSPSVLKEGPIYPIKGSSKVIFIREQESTNPKYPNVYIKDREEGSDAVVEIEQLLKRNQPKL